MESKFQKRIRGRGILRAIAILACLLTVGLSATWLYAPTAIPTEKLERGFKATFDYVKDGGSALIRVANQPLPIKVASPEVENAESPQDELLEARSPQPLSGGGTKKQDRRKN